MTTPSALHDRLAITMGPTEEALIGALRGARSRADYAQDLIDRLLRCPGSTRDRLSKHPAPPLPPGPSRCSRLALRLPAQERERFESWCGKKLAVADALRAAIHADSEGLLGADSSRTPAASAEPGARSRPAPRPAPSVPRAARGRRRGGPRTRAKRARAPKVAAETSVPRSGNAAHERALAAIAARVAGRRQTWGGLALEPMIDTRHDRATESESDVLVDALGREDSGIVIAPAWSPAVERELATWIADRPSGDDFRVVLGLRRADDDPDLLGLDDPGDVAQSVLALARRLGRDGSYTATVHFLSRADGAVLGVVEVSADLR